MVNGGRQVQRCSSHLQGGAARRQLSRCRRTRLNSQMRCPGRRAGTLAARAEPCQGSEGWLVFGTALERLAPPPGAVVGGGGGAGGRRRLPRAPEPNPLLLRERRPRPPPHCILGQAAVPHFAVAMGRRHVHTCGLHASMHDVCGAPHSISCKSPPGGRAFVLESTTAPASIRSRATAVWPTQQAQCSAVQPSSTSTPCTHIRGYQPLTACDTCSLMQVG